MKQRLVFIFLIVTNISYGQIPDSLILTFNHLLNEKKTISSFDLKQDVSHEQILLEFDFGSDQLTDHELLKSLKEATILHVSFIYSAFKVSDSFKQGDLNKKRLYSFYKSVPHAFKNVKWEIIEQNDIESHNKAIGFFHGFVVDYRAKATSESIKEEISFIKESLDFFEPSKPEPKLYREPSRANLPLTAEEYYLQIKELNEKSKKEQAIPKIDVSLSRYFEDTTVIAVFERNSEWENMLVTCDLTASMSPYVAQLFVWFKYKMEKKKIKHFVFFNDGNTLADFRKEIGKTGGIYFSNADSVEEALGTAERCMANTNGGDTQENDIEALIKGIDYYNDYKDVILVADNLANMGDYELIDQLTKPIHIILCGTSKGVNPQYLDLARATKGWVHTLELDIKELETINEGERLKIGEQTFQLINGRFLEVK